MTLTDMAGAVGGTGLRLVGAFHPGPEDGAPDGVRTLVLLGPADGAMWTVFSGSTEAHDGQPDPLDRWSRRIIGQLADRLGAVALFPFGGPPWNPFQRWAARGESAVASPVGMQATPRRGLWASYRGALGFAADVPLDDFAPGPSGAPCLGCAAPCLGACPVDAFAGGRYDVPACVAHVTGPAGAGCRSGCLVRAICPAGVEVELPVEQRRFHMAAFLRAQGAAVVHRRRLNLWTTSAGN